MLRFFWTFPAAMAALGGFDLVFLGPSPTWKLAGIGFMVVNAANAAITYSRWGRPRHKPNYNEIAQLERELGFVLPEQTVPLKAVSRLSVDLNFVLIERDPYVHVYASSAYSRRPASLLPPPKPKPRIVNEKGEPIH